MEFVFNFAKQTNNLKNTMESNFKNVKVGQTLNISIEGLETTAIVIHVSKCQIDVRFWDVTNTNQESYRSFTTKGVIKYLRENSFIKSIGI